MGVTSGAALLEVRNLVTEFSGSGGVVRAVDGVSLAVRAGETLGLVGESGCGKSMTAHSIIRLVPAPGRIVGGELRLGDVDLFALGDEDMRKVRGRDIGFIFQDPMSSLNPVLTVGRQISERLVAHRQLSRRAADERAIELLAKVRMPRPRERVRDYPHQFSGGMRQRVMVAIALACEPKLVIADEPTTALDVTIQAQVLDLIRALSDEMGTAVLLITHDMGIAAGMCDRVNIMYAGRIVESGSVDDVFGRSMMPYAWGMLDSLPRLDDEPGSMLRTIEGLPPDLRLRSPECRFAPRCAYARERCHGEEPDLTARPGDGHYARCFGTEPGGWLTS